MIFYAHYCGDCTCTFISDNRHARCWACNSKETANCYGERYSDASGKKTHKAQMQERNVNDTRYNRKRGNAMIEYISPDELEDLAVLVDRGDFVDIFTSRPTGDDCQAFRLPVYTLPQVIARIQELKRKDSTT